MNIMKTVYPVLDEIVDEDCNNLPLTYRVYSETLQSTIILRVNIASAFCKA